MEFLYFLIIVAVLGGVFFFFNKGKSDVVDSSGESGLKPTPVTAPAPKKEVVKEEAKKVPSKAVLNKMTKKELDAFASDFGVTLDARKNKAAMITDFQKEAKKK